MSQIATDARIDKSTLIQVEQILNSETFRNSETLRRLLKFLAEKYAAGEADQLKEYTIALEGLERPSTYDPKRDSAVRIQAGRLRQKLAEYYRTEGKNDPLIIGLPKGHFKLTCAHRATIDEVPSRAKSRSEWLVTWAGASMWLISMIVIVWGTYTIIGTRHAEAISSPAGATWTSDLEALWQPFVGTSRPTIIAIQDPLFVELQWGPGIYYRDKSSHDWSDALNSPGMRALSKAFRGATAQPSRYYTSFGEVNAAFLLGRQLGSRESNVSIVRSSELLWQQLADNNVVFVGVEPFFDKPSPAMPVRPEFVPVSGGIRNLHPERGEPETFADRFSTAPAEAGEVYALVTHSPGPMGNSDVETFISNRAAGYVGAVQCFTDPNFARTLVAALMKAYGGVPHYYQIVLKVEFKDEVPTQTTFVLSRELH